MSSFLRFTTLLLCCISFNATADAVTPLAAGDRVDFAQLQDQHSNGFGTGEKMALVLFVRGMKTKDLVSDSLAGINTACLNEGQVVYVADISKMPGFIARMVAIPSMREYPYPIWLDRQGKVTAALPVQEDAVSVLTIAQRKISQVEYFVDVAALTQRLSVLCGVAAQH